MTFAHCRSVGSLATSDDETTAMGHGVDGIGDDITENLANVPLKTLNGFIGSFSLLNLDSCIANSSFVEV